MEEVLVFKTNASRHVNLRRLNRYLKQRDGVKSWNFDFEDRDNIFRLVSTGIRAGKVREILAGIGIEAEELEDTFVPAGGVAGQADPPPVARFATGGRMS